MSSEESPTPIEPRESLVQFNAVKHGIYSVSPVIPWFEDEDDWLAFRDSIFESLRPEGGLEQALADRVALLLWRLMRIIRYERESVTNSLSAVRRDLETAIYLRDEQLPADEVTPQMKTEMDRMAMDRLLPDDQTQNKIMRTETRLHRHLLQTLHQLALIKGFRHNLPHNSKHGVASLDAPPYNRNKPALPQGPSLSSGA